MNTPSSKLTPEQIAAGWIEIEDEEQLWELHNGFYVMMSPALVEPIKAIKDMDGWIIPRSGKLSAAGVSAVFIAYRPVPSRDDYEQLVSMNNGLSVQLIHAKNEVDELREQLAANNGKTLRDEIAINAGPAMALVVEEGAVYDGFSAYAKTAYEYADAMLEARKGGGG